MRKQALIIAGIAVSFLSMGYALGQARQSLVKGIGTVYIHSPNKQLAKWYAEKLDLDVAYETPTWIQFGMLGGSTFAVDVTSYPRSIVENQHVVISFQVEDIAKTVDEMQKRGVQFVRLSDGSVIQSKEGGPLIATFVDGDGNFAQIAQARQ